MPPAIFSPAPKAPPRNTNCSPAAGRSPIALQHTITSQPAQRRRMHMKSFGMEEETDVLGLEDIDPSEIMGLGEEDDEDSTEMVGLEDDEEYSGMGDEEEEEGEEEQTTLRRPGLRVALRARRRARLLTVAAIRARRKARLALRAGLRARIRARLLQKAAMKARRRARFIKKAAVASKLQTR